MPRTFGLTVRSGNGYPVEGYQTYKACPDEIYQITMGTPSSRIAPENNQVLSTRGLILSGYKDGRIVEDFTMRCRFTTFLILGFPLITQFDTQFLELENGNLIYIKDYRSQGETFHAGDYIRYKTYTLNPNEAVVIGKNRALRPGFFANSVIKTVQSRRHLLNRTMILNNNSQMCRRNCNSHSPMCKMFRRV